MATNHGPVIRAPKGHVWAWSTVEGAHLVSLDDLSSPKCGAPWDQLGFPSMSYAVGGYSARPCQECLAWIINNLARSSEE